MTIMVHESIIVRDSERISMAGGVRQMKCPYSDFNRIHLINIRVIESQNAFY